MTPPSLSRRERQIMDILYRRGRATGTEVMDGSGRFIGPSKGLGGLFEGRCKPEIRPLRQRQVRHVRPPNWLLNSDHDR